jgi:hypothetical protein
MYSLLQPSLDFTWSPSYLPAASIILTHSLLQTIHYRLHVLFQYRDWENGRKGLEWQSYQKWGAGNEMSEDL